ncbi:MAG: hypothetical protein ACC726_16960, partial [Chloroflexota bacterium]
PGSDPITSVEIEAIAKLYTAALYGYAREEYPSFYDYMLTRRTGDLEAALANEAWTQESLAWRVVNLTDTARASSSAGDAVRSDAYLELAKTYYRIAVDRSEADPQAFLDLVTIEASRRGPGAASGDLDLVIEAPEGKVDICTTGTAREVSLEGTDITQDVFNSVVDPARPWECALEPDGKVIRVAEDEVSPISEGITREYEVAG